MHLPTQKGKKMMACIVHRALSNPSSPNTQPHTYRPLYGRSALLLLLPCMFWQQYCEAPEHGGTYTMPRVGTGYLALQTIAVKDWP